MSMTKKVSLVVMLACIIGAIWYLEGMNAHPSGGAAGSGQAINISPTSTATSTMDEMNGVGAMTEASGSAATSGSAMTGGTMSGSASMSPEVSAALRTLAAADVQAGDQPAIEIADPTGFVNVSSTFTLKSQVGKNVILLDFWTYSCINCIRTIPYLNAWYAKYKDAGLVIVGIHTPEFDFEKDIDNVQTAVTADGIKYPVILDSNYGTWNAYNNLYWPHEYLIDLAGYIVHDHVGEGDYATTESDIQQQLLTRAEILGIPTSTVPTGTVDITAPNLNEILSPETYFGAERNSALADGKYFTNGTQTLPAPPANPTMNYLYLSGTWTFDDQYATNASSGAEVTFQYNAGKVYMVAASSMPNGTRVEVLQDGQPVSAADAGSDVHNGYVTITGNTIYNLINNADGGGIHTLQLIVQSPGLQAYTFTFG